MWARWCEILIALWLAVSPWIFAGSWVSPWPHYADDFAIAAVFLAAIASHFRPARHAHLLSAAVATWLILVAWFQADDSATAAQQSRFLTGLLLLMFAILPNHASTPPPAWKKESELFY